MADVCAKLAEDANAIVTQMRKTPTNEEYLEELFHYRKDLNEVISLIMAGNDKKALRMWRDSEIDGLFSERLQDMPHIGTEFNFAKWPKKDVAVYKAHEQITAIVNNIVNVCPPGKKSAPANRAGNGAATRNVRTNAQRAANNGNGRTRSNKNGNNSANAARRRMQNERNAAAFLRGNNSLF